MPPIRNSRANQGSGDGARRNAIALADKANFQTSRTVQCSILRKYAGNTQVGRGREAEQSPRWLPGGRGAHRSGRTAAPGIGLAPTARPPQPTRVGRSIRQRTTELLRCRARKERAVDGRARPGRGEIQRCTGRRCQAGRARSGSKRAGSVARSALRPRSRSCGGQARQTAGRPLRQMTFLTMSKSKMPDHADSILEHSMNTAKNQRLCVPAGQVRGDGAAPTARADSPPWAVPFFGWSWPVAEGRLLGGPNR